jgi:hypothetical protein
MKFKFIARGCCQSWSLRSGARVTANRRTGTRLPARRRCRRSRRASNSSRRPSHYEHCGFLILSQDIEMASVS